MSKLEIVINGKKENIPLGTIASEALKIAKVPLKGAQKPLAIRFNDTLMDLESPLTEDGNLMVLTKESPEALKILRHSTAHLMAEAVKELFPEVKVSIGPAVEDGFYYDFETTEPFRPEVLPEIEKKMKQIIKANQAFVRSTLPVKEALVFFENEKENYKVELINDLVCQQGVEEVSLYKSGSFTDLCLGPHIPKAGYVGAYKLLSIAGAYWRGDEKNKMLQRIYGTAFFDREQLTEHLNLLEEAKKRDHRRLGKELDLFSIQDEIGAGLVVWHPKGALVRSILEDFERQEHLRRGYQIVMGPQMLKTELWKKSGHWDNYRENMYFTELDEQSYGIKPMNCISHMFIYKSQLRSWRDLPYRMFELGTVLRHEKSGVLHGLTRVRQFTQDDAHIICTPKQVHNEIIAILDLVIDMMDAFGFEYEMELSTRPEKSIGTDEDWELATQALKQALIDKGVKYTIDEGDGAFYGPKIDVQLKDALGRKWQCSTIQCDFTLPERFDLSYVATDGERKRPVMLHRTIFGSLERFVGILIEHFAGAFPVWLAPVQAKILTVTSRIDDFAQEIYETLRKKDLRVELDLRNEKLGYKIREGQMAKIPYLLIVGDKELEDKSVSVRQYGGQDLGSMSISDFFEKLLIASKKPSW